jgi:hypothetical protein
MIKVRKAYVLVIAGLLAPALIASAAAAFGFSFPFGTIVAGPGLAAAGPTTFNTYFHDSTFANAGCAADVAANAYAPGLGCGIPFGTCGGFSPLPGCLPAIPFGYGLGPYGVANAANTLATSGWGQDNTFATSFSTGGAVAGAPLGAAHFAGTFPQFALNLF